MAGSTGSTLCGRLPCNLIWLYHMAHDIVRTMSGFARIGWRFGLLFGFHFVSALLDVC